MSFDSCHCAACVAERAARSAATIVTKPITGADSQSAASTLEQKFADRGIALIPDSDVTDMGDYVIWNKYDPTYTLMIDPQLGLDKMPLKDLYYTWDRDERLETKYITYPNKKVRVTGLYELKHEMMGVSSYRYFYARDGAQYSCSLDAGHSYTNSTRVGGVIRRVTDTPAVRRIPLHAMPRLSRISMAAAIANTKVFGGAFNSERQSRLAVTPVTHPKFGRAPLYLEPWRGAAIHMFKYHRESLKALGDIIRNCDDHEAEDLIDAVDNCTCVPNEARALGAWNELCTGGQEVKRFSCGHLASSGDGNEVHGGDEVCSNCFENDYVRCEDTGNYHSRSDAYRHSDDLYYTYTEYDPYDDDDDDRQHRSVRSYTTNVLDTLDSDSTIVSSQYGDFLMGVELEVVPKDGTRSHMATAAHTAKELCPGYAILKSDGSLSEGGFEIVTAPRGLKEHIERFTNWTPHETLRAWDANCCGLHVHVSSLAFSKATLGKYIQFINDTANTGMLLAIAGRDPSVNDQAARYCQREGYVARGNPKQTVENKDGSRYRMVNTTNCDRAERDRLGLPYQEGGRAFNTVELRIFRASLKKARLLAQIEFAHAAVMFCRWSSMRELDEPHFLAWLRKSAGMYPHLAKWFGVRSNSMAVVTAPPVRSAAEV